MEGIRNPIRHIRKGDVEATIWFFEPRTRANRGWYYVTFSRIYRDGKTERDGSFYRFSDLVNLERVSWRAALDLVLGRLEVSKTLVTTLVRLAGQIRSDPLTSAGAIAPALIRRLNITT